MKKKEILCDICGKHINYNDYLFARCKRFDLYHYGVMARKMDICEDCFLEFKEFISDKLVERKKDK